MGSNPTADKFDVLTHRHLGVEIAQAGLSFIFGSSCWSTSTRHASLAEHDARDARVSRESVGTSRSARVEVCATPIYKMEDCGMGEGFWFSNESMK